MSGEEDDKILKLASAGVLETSSIQCSALRKQGHVLLNGSPCKILDMSTSRAGRRLKVHIVGIDIFTGKKLEDIVVSTDKMDVPLVSCSEYQLVAIDDGFLKLMTQDSTCKDDVKVPHSDLGKDIQAQFEDGKNLMVTLISAMGKKQAISFREAPRGDDESSSSI